jgi:cell division protein FtsA
MKIQFGSALADEAKANAYITIPGVRGLPKKEISVKMLANIIQARMSEIMDFVSFHIKQVGLDNRMLNGGIILTGGGSQLKHLIQLTEYVTGLNARIGYPNEHLAAGHFEELTKPQYSTCIGLILKGYDVFETSLNEHRKEYIGEEIVVTRLPVEEPTVIVEPIATESVIQRKQKKKVSDLFNGIKDKIIDIFESEKDTTI